MKILLDTHSVIWWFNGNAALSPAARAAIERDDSEVFVSAVSAMEITTKHRLGKLPEAERLATRFQAMIAEQDITPLDLKLAHGLFSVGLGQKVGTITQAGRAQAFERAPNAQAHGIRLGWQSCNQDGPHMKHILHHMKY